MSKQIFMTIDCDGVPDSDNDGWCDDIDPCPYTPGVNCPKSDIDHDGIPDDEDDCPNAPGTSYYNGCPAPGEKDTDGDGTPDTYDHCPDYSSNNGCPLPENCLCAKREDVKELLSNLEVQEDLIREGEKLIEEKRNEAKDIFLKIEGAFEKESENDAVDCIVDTVSGIALGIGIVYSGGALIEVLGLIFDAAITEYNIWEKHPVLYKVPAYQKEIAAIAQIIDHHKEILQYHQDLKRKFISDLHEICPCALEYEK